ncbi:Hypothetical predicted protein [Cloeon dipterum]|uniref:Uncharacterized protein n=1 Tax=Cloeon dipterum TaxID=197152 RepID=A0A8S1CIJ6_9INSE|nr:Hypothetical predicted protein [Cloeon dipterum]
MSINRSSRESFINDFPMFPRMSRVDLEGRIDSSVSWQEWTTVAASAVGNVYKNNVFQPTIIMLAITAVLVLILLLIPQHLTSVLRDEYVDLAIKAFITCSFVAFILLRQHLHTSLSLVPLALLLATTSAEVSSSCAGCRPGAYTVGLLLCATLVVGVHQGALASKPNLILLAGATVVTFLLVVNLNFITAIIGTTPAVKMFIYSLSTALAVLNIMGLSVLIADDAAHPFEINDMVSCAAFMYLMIAYLFANIMLFTDTIQNIRD